MENENIKTEEQVEEDNKYVKAGIAVWIGIAVVSYVIGGNVGYKQGMKEGMAAGMVRGYAKCMFDVVNKFR